MDLTLLAPALEETVAEGQPSKAQEADPVAADPTMARRVARPPFNALRVPRLRGMVAPLLRPPLVPRGRPSPAGSESAPRSNPFDNPSDHNRRVRRTFSDPRDDHTGDDHPRDHDARDDHWYPRNRDHQSDEDDENDKNAGEAASQTDGPPEQTGLQHGRADDGQPHQDHDKRAAYQPGERETAC